MSLPLVFGVAGAAVGYATGFGSLAVSLGWSLGSFLGASLTKQELPTVYGPQLSDLSITTSAFGQMIPFGYGTFPVAGNIIWGTNWRKREVVTEVETGGKGGGGSTQTSVSYYYDADFAVLVHDGSIIGVRKIWSSGKLLHDVGNDSTPDSVLASSADITIYTGSETQVPDTTIETAEGVGNVPAWRGYAYVVFKNFRRENFGNFKFEVVQSGSSALTQQTLYTLTGGEEFGGDVVPNGAYNDTDQYADAREVVTSDGVYTWAVLDNAGGNNRLALIDNYTGAFVFTKDLTSAAMFGAPFYIVALGYNDRVWVATYADGLVFHCAFFCVELSGEEHWMLGPQASFDSRLWRRGYEVAPPASSVGDTQQDNPVLYLPHTVTNTPIYRLTGINLNADGIQLTTTAVTQSFLRNEFSMGADRVDGRLYVNTFDPGVGNRVGYINLETIAYTFVGATYTSAGTEPWSYVGNDGFLYVRSANTAEANVIEKRSTAGALVDSVALSNWTATNFDYPHFVQSADGAYLYVQMSTTAWKIATGTMTEEWTMAMTTGDAIRPTDAFHSDGILVVRATVGGANNVMRVIDASRITSTSPTLASVATDLCTTRAGLTAADLDVSAISGITVTGYPIVKQDSVRSMLEPLLGAYSVDAVESDNVIKFVVRGGASAVTIPENDLAAHDGAAAEMPDQLSVVRTEELELPLEVLARYLNKAADYQVSQQPSRRLITSAKQTVMLSIPLVLSDDQAKRLADINMYSAWLEREKFEFETSRKYAKYEPTDVMTVVKAGVNRVCRATKKAEGANGVIKWSAVAEDSAIYSQTSTGGAFTGTAASISLLGPTIAEMIDMHLLRDVDDDAGFYFGAKGHTSSWRGAQLYQSKDDGVNYSLLANSTILTASSFGRTTTALGDFSNVEGNERFDEANTVRVTAPGLVLSSYTRAQIYAGTAVPYLVGDEIIYARTATLVSAGTYDLTSLLRGRKGTESYMTGHSASERFVVLNDSLRSIYDTFADAAIELDYKAVSVGSTLAETANKKFVNTAKRKRPLAPWHLKAGRLNAANDIQLECKRRTRFDNPWRDGADAPLGETIEQYRWDIYSGASIVRSVTSTVPYYVYAVADQTTDFGSAQTSIKFAVAQISSEYGLGYATGPTTFTLT